MRELISIKKERKKAQAGIEWMVEHSPRSLACVEKATICQTRRSQLSGGNKVHQNTSRPKGLVHWAWHTSLSDRRGLGKWNGMNRGSKIRQNPCRGKRSTLSYILTYPTTRDNINEGNCNALGLSSWKKKKIGGILSTQHRADIIFCGWLGRKHQLTNSTPH